MFKFAGAGLLYRSWQPVVFGCEADEAAGCWKADCEVAEECAGGPGPQPLMSPVFTLSLPAPVATLTPPEPQSVGN